MALKYLREMKHKETVEAIAKARFPFPDEDNPDLKTFVNEPEPRISIGEYNGQELFPDIVVVKHPGQWLRFFAEVETADTVNDEEAINQWKPFSQQGEFYLFVPMGMAEEAKRICKRHDIEVAGIRTYRFRPVWGVDIRET